ncbi:nuclear transport factor 2 family protein [Pseudonocardia alaniniphila]|uniref:Nuclear transport factor 2 family protein n=1 Tax=Pseudonocardia alaniniphila TaxID=75291 RepID=A0ABS9TV64_9PSEU|nr:nuclear transport factor 2 family protein [Pseudonocardia alaniniphila]MCH6172396.1 nuclear transport factor 2 family protein [Pseudonocardia alaniniphila]
MKNARELLLAYLDGFREPEKAAALFTNDGVLELPYLESLGLPSGVTGPEAIRSFLEDLLKNAPDFAFGETEILIDTPDQVFAEYRVDTVLANGRRYQQLYAGRLVACDGKIALLRESLDLVHAARAMLPGGTADIPA